MTWLTICSVDTLDRLSLVLDGAGLDDDPLLDYLDQWLAFMIDTLSEQGVLNTSYPGTISRSAIISHIPAHNSAT